MVRRLVNRSILPAGKKSANLEFDARESTVVALKCRQPVPTGNIPKHHLPIATRTDDPAVLKPDGIHGPFVPAQGPVKFEGLAVPHPDHCVFRAVSRR